MYPFLKEKSYTRRDIYKIIGLPEDTKGGNWDTGYNKYLNDFFLFCNVGIPGRTGHDYENRFNGSELHWYAKGPTRTDHPQIQELLHPSGMVYIFFRTADDVPFTYAGTGRPKSHAEEKPVQITWEISVDETIIPPDITAAQFQTFNEGALKSIQVNAYERNPAARSACIEHYGYSCQICGFSFEKMYGTAGQEFIHVHHIVPLYEIRGEYSINPTKDLIPVCANCHAVIHRRHPAYTIEEMHFLLEENRQ